MNKIFTFPFSGGNKWSYNKILQDNNFVLSIENMGNNDFFLMETVCKTIKSFSEDCNFLFYGHSLGALSGFLLCQKLQEHGLPLPQKLIVTGKKAPHIPREKKISHLPDEEFWNEILTLGGIPDEMQNYPELIEYYLPILRHDFKLVESYEYENKPKLNIPIDVFYGSEEATEEEMIGWQDETTEKVTITQLPGNHFFIFDHVEYFRNYFDKLIHQK